MKCRLCDSSENLLDSEAYWSPTAKPNWNYFRCSHCDYLQMLERDFMSPEAELQRYQHHQNEDSSYRHYFEQFVLRIQSHLVSTSNLGSTATAKQSNAKLGESSQVQILDYGCGPYPMLSQVLQAQGFLVQGYDPNFLPQKISTKFDVVILHEVIEHMHRPADFFQELGQILKPNGRVIISTKFYQKKAQFENWSYRRDQTHVGFFNQQTFQFIEKKWAAKIIDLADPIVVFQF